MLVGYLAGVALLMVASQLGRVAGVAVQGDTTLAAAAGVVAAGILDRVLLAVGLSVAELLIRVGRPHDAILGVVPGLAGMHDVDDYPRAQTLPGLVVYRYDAPLFFANAQDFRRRALAAAELGLTGKIGKARILPTLPTAVAAFQDWAREHPPDGPPAAPL